MEFNEVKRIVLRVLENNGIIVENEDMDVDLSSYSIDSIMFISFIIDMENEMSVVFPGDYLTVDVLKSIDGLTNLLLELKHKNMEGLN